MPTPDTMRLTSEVPSGVTELRARGMPLGLMPGMEYEELETALAPGDALLFYSDGLVEAHNSKREMFSFPRLRDLMGQHEGSRPEDLVDFLLQELSDFTGPEWEQEDDITLVTLQRVENVAGLTSFANQMVNEEADSSQPVEGDPSSDPERVAWSTVTAFSLPSQPGNERVAIQQVIEAIEPLGLPPSSIERLQTAVGEGVMNAMEHGNKYQPDVPVVIRAEVSNGAIRVGITDQGDPIPLESEQPDIELKLAGMQSPRGWGMFLIKNMVDEMQVVDDAAGHTLQLMIQRKGDSDGQPNL